MTTETSETSARFKEVENNFGTLDKMQEYFIRLYGRRNNVYLPGRNVRISLFHRGVADLIDTIRKDSGRGNLEVMFVRVGSRVFLFGKRD